MIRRTIVCDGCFIEAETPDGVLLAKTAADARTRAQRFGWKITRRRDLCPECKEES